MRIIYKERERESIGNYSFYYFIIIFHIVKQLDNRIKFKHH